jgi:hypothetical protein
MVREHYADEDGDRSVRGPRQSDPARAPRDYLFLGV